MSRPAVTIENCFYECHAITVMIRPCESTNRSSNTWQQRVNTW
jgi:hypothetical protein